MSEMITRLAAFTALILALAAVFLFGALAGLMDERLKGLEQGPSAVEQGRRSA